MTAEPDGVPRPSDADAAYLEERKGSGVELEAAERDSAKSLESAGVPGLNAVRGLISATYFSDLLCHLAYKRFKHEAPEARVAAMIGAHPKFAAFCRHGDFVYRALAATVLLGSLTAVAIGTIVKVFV